MKESLKCWFTLIIAIIPFFRWPTVNREFTVLSFALAIESSPSQDFLFGSRRSHLNHYPALASSLDSDGLITFVQDYKQLKPR